MYSLNCSHDLTDVYSFGYGYRSAFDKTLVRLKVYGSYSQISLPIVASCIFEMMYRKCLCRYSF